MPSSHASDGASGDAAGRMAESHGGRAQVFQELESGAVLGHGLAHAAACGLAWPATIIAMGRTRQPVSLSVVSRTSSDGKCASF
eukprot:9183062-Alexandrium_andersonii.AAC.1